MINRTQPPAIQGFKPLDIQPPHITTLPNGIPIYSFEAGNQPLTRIELIFETQNHNNPLVPTITNRMLQEGTHLQNAAQIAETFDFCGAHLQNSQSMDFATVSLYSLNKHLDGLLSTFFDITNQPTFPQKELTTTLKNSQQDLSINQEKVAFLARRKFNATIFGEDSRYGNFAQTTDYDNVNADDLRYFFEKNYTATNLSVYVAGKDTQQTIQKIAPYLLKINTQSADSQTIVQKIEKKQPQKIFVQKNDAIQNALMVGAISIPKNHPDYISLKIVNTILGGYFGSRLMSNIREDKGYTYGIGSNLSSYKNATIFSIFTEVGSNVSKLALQEIYKEIDLLCTKKVEAEELDTVKNYLRGALIGSFDGVFARADRFKDVHLFGLGYDYYHQFEKTLQTITPERIQTLAQTYLAPQTLTEIVVGSE
jgi:predicted Zn-dependent peptidase